ncbi:MAG: nucleoside hydrolase, partial [Planctomycetota bacterium]
MSGTRKSANVPLRTAIAWIAFVMIFLLAFAAGASGNDSPSRPSKKIPVIFDTDICDDIDDTWALALLLQSPEFDVKLVTTAVGNTASKAKTVARFLEIAGRTDIPIGIGVKQRDGSHRQDAWAKDYKLSSYPGTIHEDG